MTLTILVTPVPAVGHVNACVGTISGLVRRGHRIIFVLESTFAGKLKPFGFEEHVVQSSKAADAAEEATAKALLALKVIGPYTPQEKLQSFVNFAFTEQNLADKKAFNSSIQDAIEKYKPDLIYADCLMLFPAIYYSGIKWIRNISTTPICYILDDDTPPSGSGLPSLEDRKEWAEFEKIRKGFFYSEKYNDFIESIGYERYPTSLICPETQALTVYAYPDELNYPVLRSKDNWFNLQAFHPGKTQPEPVPLAQLVTEDFMNENLDGKFSGKLIYVSMGTFGSIDLELMKRLVELLGKLNHKFIFSKGPRHAEFDLPRNMYGHGYLPQTKILPHVDLVITHGGNNTVTEVFAEGKPMIILPLFADQFDNAQRVQEMGFGARFDPYSLNEDDFISTIDKLIYDKELNQKLLDASERIKSLSKHEELAVKIEQLIKKNVE